MCGIFDLLNSTSYTRLRWLLICSCGGGGVATGPLRCGRGGRDNGQDGLKSNRTFWQFRTFRGNFEFGERSHTEVLECSSTQGLELWSAQMLVHLNAPRYKLKSA